MKATLKFEIECGEKTCAYDDGVRCCKFWLFTKNGNGKCRLFGNLFIGKIGLEKWAMRHPECLKRAVKKVLQTVEWEMVKAEENEENK